MSRRTHTPPAWAFDWSGFAKLLPLQPAPAWLACSLALRPLARATPRLLDAACSGALRQGLVDSAFVVYILVLPPAAAAGVYFLAGRRRMTPLLRRIGDWSLALVLLVSAVNDAGLIRRTVADWTTIRPGLIALRASCLP